MKRHQPKIVCVFAVIVSCLIMRAPLVWGQHDDKFGRATLQGLKGVYVLVEDLPLELTGFGLTVDQIQSDVELKLRSLGIEVLSRETLFLKSKGLPHLYVNVGGFRVESIPA